MPRPLILTGFMATGKSTVGRRVAELAGTAFEDLDARIEQRAGKRVADLFAERGEAGFRALERSELEAVLGEPAVRVIALGGGALLARDLRLVALERAVVITLTAPSTTLAARIADGATRPLLAIDSGRRVTELLELRAPAYAEAHAVVDTGSADVDACARNVLRIWERDAIAVAAGHSTYTVDVGSAIAADRVPALTQGATHVLLVSDENVAALHAAGVQRALPRAHTLLSLEPGEPTKSPATLERVWRAALDAGLDRRSRIVALGGGVVSDIAGFAAATWMRGIQWAALPTTLLAMVDASVGGKTAVDLADAKNVVGAFWQPSGVVCDVAFLATEPERGFVSALSEVVKTALIGDAALFELLEHRAGAIRARDPEILVEIVRRSVIVKARIVGRDERESGERATLNLGHTVGHALEAHGAYTRWTHGEAVALGLVAALRVGAQLGHTPPHLANRVIGLLRRLGLPVDLAQQPLGAATKLVARDKKRTGKSLRFVVAHDLGRVAYIDLPLAELTKHLETLA